ncbi:beta-1,3-galactosyltransferase 5-like [Biomphalaria glabrata]|uniref:Hexosyltransferase n=1 Tax=Biomphalaria glabrata TaxID=6526 RepID=A0A9U8DVH0_BIOGL|nr:beta-1,3-galactosyltransferase 5-like [Biomphalaria glabrata]XP_055900690.1 beta-1,3-galactosyltransferase 5-like [Biomphalaria glabrata]XP_055900691.1 beta-1,3-galactosyltransferase 5-like [Biomphalaria glabrata]XP_055900692.1 beta-1,3-galactosyltransferase 5-like [Biomphalaria glabrata]XP_055900694.1 beta-1,3-galactosyltransferase 5-like [Biomphalaria glabrata]
MAFMHRIHKALVFVSASSVIAIVFFLFPSNIYLSSSQANSLLLTEKSFSTLKPNDTQIVQRPTEYLPTGGTQLIERSTEYLRTSSTQLVLMTNSSLKESELLRSKYDRCPECYRAAVRDVSGALVEVPLSSQPGQPQVFNKPRESVVSSWVMHSILTPRVCSSSPPYLLVLQMSVPSEINARNAVRETWASVASGRKWPNRVVNADVKVVFVIGHGTSNDTRIDKEAVSAESATHGDILYLDMMESYRNLTLKVVSSLYWVKVTCPGVRFVAKVDVDTFVNVPLLVDTLLVEEIKLNFAILGYVYKKEKSVVLREGAWAVSESLFPGPYYPVYASGCAYILSQEVVSKIVEAAPYIPMLPVEDVFLTGIMRHVIQCQLFSLDHYFTHKLDLKWSVCSMYLDQKIMGTSCDEVKLREVWGKYQRSDGQCS